METVIVEKKDIKEIKELFAGIELLAIQSAKCFKDKKLDLADLQNLLPVLVNFPILVESVKGIDQLPAEVSDLDAAETIELVQLVFDLVKKIKAEL